MRTVGYKLGWLGMSLLVHGVLLAVLSVLMIVMPAISALAMPRLVGGGMRVRFVQQIITPSGPPRFVAIVTPPPPPDVPVKPTHTGPRTTGRGDDPTVIATTATPPLRPGDGGARKTGAGGDPRIDVGTDLGKLPPLNGGGGTGGNRTSDSPGAVEPVPTGPTEPAKLVSVATARRPKNAQNLEAAGVTIVQVAVDASGNGRARIEQSSGDPDLDRVAKKAAESASYTPAQDKGTRVAGSARLKFSFSRDNEYSKGVQL